MAHKEAILEEFQSKKVYQLLKKTGVPRVSQDSVKALNKLMTRHARQIATKAVQFASEKGRETVLGEDITQAVRMTGTTVAYEIEQEAPVVHYVWFISSGGTCLLSRSYSGIEFPDTIFAGLLTGILDLMREVTGRNIETFSTDDLTIHIRRISEITVAVVCDSEKEEPIDELTDLLALRFSEVFSKEIQLDIVDTSIFDEFAPVLDALVSSAGLSIPKEKLKVIKTSVSLTDKQLEETVDATALREELRRAREKIQDLAVFRKDDELEAVNSTTVDSMFDEPPDVTEIKAVLRQASQNIRNANGNDLYPPDNEISREDIMKEISKDFSTIITEKESKTIDIKKGIKIKEESKMDKIPSSKKTPKKKSKRRRKRKKSRK
ncbi:MAG: histone [Candidatus Hodarchaeota archaeon]